MDEDLRFQKYYEKALRFLSYRPRSEKEVRDKLRTKQTPPEYLEKIITILKKQRFLNDEEFALWWIRQRATFRPKGTSIITIELKQKGISIDIIAKALATQTADDSMPTDAETARTLVEKQLPKYKDLPRAQLYQKLGTYLARRGYRWDLIKTSIDDVLKKQYNRA